MSNQELSTLTRNHYETLIKDMGAAYTDYRWKSSPVQRSHYRHTRYAVYSFFKDVVGRANKTLEVGCGPGVWTDICLRHSDSVSLLDISEEMLKVAKAKYENEKRLEHYYCSDYIQTAHTLPVGFDVVFSARAIEYMSDKKAMVHQSYRLLKSGGLLAVITKNPMWRDKARSSRQKTDGIQRDWIYWKDLAVLFRNAGFEQVFVRPVAIGSYHSPYNNRAGIVFCDALHMAIRNNNMRGSYDKMSESYIVVGKKP